MAALPEIAKCLVKMMLVCGVKLLYMLNKMKIKEYTFCDIHLFLSLYNS